MLRELRNYIDDKEFRVCLLKNSVNVINYCSIFAIEKTRVSLSYNDGTLIIKGNNLTLKKMLENELLVYGEIKSIELE